MIDIPVHIQLQHISGIVSRATFSGRFSLEAHCTYIKAIYEGINCPYFIILVDILIESIW